MANFTVQVPYIVARELARKIKEADLTPQQRRVFGDIFSTGCLSGAEVRDHHDSRAQVHETMKRRLYEKYVDTLLEGLPEAHRDLASTLALVAYQGSYRVKNSNPHSLAYLRKTLLENL